jgi:hypothetical protein
MCEVYAVCSNADALCAARWNAAAGLYSSAMRCVSCILMFLFGGFDVGLFSFTHTVNCYALTVAL